MTQMTAAMRTRRKSCCPAMQVSTFNTTLLPIRPLNLCYALTMNISFRC